jgi:uncharacterized protein (TIGR04255 family)
VERYGGWSVFALDPVSRYRLEGPPLAQAIGQIRYPLRAWLQTADGVVDLQRELLDLFPYMNQEQLQQVALLMGPGITPASEAQTQRAWRFTDDAGWVLVVTADSASLSVGPEYADFEEFRIRFAAVVAALRQTAGVPRCDRLGLRYVDIAEVPPGNETAWRDWFRPELTGWAAGDVVGENTRVLTTITQSHLAAPPLTDGGEPPLDVQALVRHGYVPAKSVIPGVAHGPIDSPAFLLDIDLFVEGHQPFTAEDLTQQVTVLHDQIDRFFRWALTPAGEAYFGLEELQ